MNQHINRVRQAFDHILAADDTLPVVLYPGDKWSPGQSHDSSEALSRYDADYDAALQNPVRVTSQVTPLETLIKGGNAFIRTLSRMNSRLLLHRMVPAIINVHDHGVTLRLDHHGLVQVARAPFKKHDISLSSSALHYALRFPWGGETLMINGRFYAPESGNRSNFFRWTSIAQANSRAVYYYRAYYIDKVLALGRRVVKTHGKHKTRTALAAAR